MEITPEVKLEGDEYLEPKWLRCYSEFLVGSGDQDFFRTLKNVLKHLNQCDTQTQHKS